MMRAREIILFTGAIGLGIGASYIPDTVSTIVRTVDEILLEAERNERVIFTVEKGLDQNPVSSPQKPRHWPIPLGK